MRGVPPSAQQATPVSIQAPVGGWNARDALSAMPETDAIQMDNVLNVNGSVQIRRGSQYWASISDTVEIGTLAVWKGPATEQMWVFAHTTSYGVRAYNISNGGALAGSGGTALPGVSDSFFSTVMFNNVSGHYLYLCNEQGGPYGIQSYYNGTTWVTPTITGIASNLLVHVNLYKFRLYFVEKDSLNVWYLGIDALQGAATKLPLGGYFNKGGKIIATGTWTVDGGDGVNDLFCVVTSAGQIAVFQGDSPSSASSWSIVGVFDIDEPLGGGRCLSKFGSDLYILTVAGVLSVRNIMQGQVGQSDAFTEKIRYAFSDHARKFRNSVGWMGLFYPRGNYFFVNAPSTPTSSSGAELPPPVMVQFVFSATTKSWSRFTNQYGRHWVVFKDRLYGAKAVGTVIRADDAASDFDGITVGAETNLIPVRVRQAYTPFGDNTRMKYVTLARPLIESDARYIPPYDINHFDIEVEVRFDYRHVPRTTAQSWAGTTYVKGPEYTEHDPIHVSRAEQVKRSTAGGGLGRYASIALTANVKTTYFGWIATEWYFKPAGIIST